MLAIQNYQQRLFNHYKESIHLPPTYKYIHGNPVQPLVPLHMPQQSVVIIGACPSARFATVGLEKNVPVEDLTAPFSEESYFDGRRTRSIPSSVTLTEAYLQPLGLKLEQCWLTNLVRLFLFNDSHLQIYRRLGCGWPEWETRSRFEALARQGLPWLEAELALARPKLVITQGAQTAAVLQDVRGAAAGEALLGGNLQDLWLGERVYPTLHLTAPHMLSQRATAQTSWLEVHWEKHLPAARGIVRQLVG